MSPWWLGVLVGGGVGAVTWVLSRRAERRRGEMLGVETLTIDTIHQLCDAAAGAAGPGAFRQSVEATGTAEAGPTGVLTSEVSKSPCVWHRHQVTRRYREVSTDAKGNRTTSTREEVVVENATEDPFVLRDVTGTIPIVPTRDVDGAKKSVSEFREPTAEPGSTMKLGPFEITIPGGDSDTIGYEYEEWLLPAGARVFVHGDATDASGELTIVEPEGKSKLIISTHSESELLADAASAARRLQIASIVGAGVAVVCAILAIV